MGYGRAGAVERTGIASGDAGIGIISQGPAQAGPHLMQAKRYAVDKRSARSGPTSSPAPSWAGDQGVYITTSSFPVPARKLTDQRPDRTLIDGAHLAGLLSCGHRSRCPGGADRRTLTARRGLFDGLWDYRLRSRIPGEASALKSSHA